MSRPPAAGDGRAARRWLGLGLGTGLVAAVAPLVVAPADPARPLPDGAVARVGDVLISADELERAAAALAADSRDPVDAADRRRLVEWLVDEELLVQHGVALGLVRDDPRVRGELVAAVIRSLTVAADDLQPSAAAVEAFYRDHRDWFARPGRVRVERVVVRAEPVRAAAVARERARAAVRRLRAGESIERVRAELGDPVVVELPRACLPPVELRERLGPSAARAALELATGGVAEPVRTALGYEVLRVAERRPTTVPPLAEIEAEVRAEMRRRAADAMLRSALAELRHRVGVGVRSEGS